MQLAHQSDGFRWQMSLVLAFYRFCLWPTIVRVDTVSICAPVIQSNHAHMLFCWSEFTIKDKDALICRAWWYMAGLRAKLCLLVTFLLQLVSVSTTILWAVQGVLHGWEGYKPKMEMWTLKCTGLCPKYITEPLKSCFESHSRYACRCWYRCKQHATQTLVYRYLKFKQGCCPANPAKLLCMTMSMTPLTTSWPSGSSHHVHTAQCNMSSSSCHALTCGPSRHAEPSGQRVLAIPAKHSAFSTTHTRWTGISNSWPGAFLVTGSNWCMTCKADNMPELQSAQHAVACRHCNMEVCCLHASWLSNADITCSILRGKCSDNSITEHICIPRAGHLQILQWNSKLW